MAAKPKSDDRVPWGFYFDHRIGKVRPLCGGQGKEKGGQKPPVADTK